MSNDFGGMPAEFQDQIDEGQRKRALAQALLQMGLQGGVQGRMVSGHYVKANPLQHLNKIAQVLSGQVIDRSAGRELSDAKGRYQAASGEELARIQAMMQPKPEMQVPNLVMQADEAGQVPTATQPDRAGDPVAAEQAAQRSRFPAAQALGKALFENRQKTLAEFRKELMGRVGVDSMGEAANADPRQPTSFQPKQKVEFVEGVPMAVPSEVVPGGPAPQRIGGGYQPTQIMGADGRPIAAQVNPATGKVDVLDKAPRVEVNNNPDKALPKIVESGYEDLRKRASDIRTQATRTIPRINQVADSVKEGIVQGSLSDVRKSIGDFANLLGIGGKDFNEMLARTGGAESALAQISAETIKQYGSNPSNIDLVNQMKAVGSIGANPQSLFHMMQIAQAMIYNSAVSHNREVDLYEGDFPEMGKRTGSLRVDTGKLPKIKIDSGSVNFNAETGFFEPRAGNMDAPVPKQGVTGPQSGAPKVQQKSLEQLREEYGLR